MTVTPIHPSSAPGKVIFWSVASFTLTRPAWLAHRALRWWRAALERVGLLAGPTFLTSVFDTVEFELLTKARPEEALSVIERRISSEPEEGFLYLQAGWICEDLKRPRDALAFYEEASKLNPGWSEEFAAYLAGRVTKLKEAP